MSARTQIIHPLTGRRISITATTRAHLEQLVRQIRELGDDQREGRIALADALERIEEKRSGTILRARLSVRACFEAWAKDQGDETSEKARAALVHFEELERLACVELTDRRLDDWAARMRGDGFAPGTIGAYFDLLAAAVRRAVRRCELAALPWKHFKAPRSPKGSRPAAAATIEELARIVAAARAVDRRRHAAGFFSDLATRVTVIALTGLRNGEAAGLGWDHVELSNDVQAVRIAVQAKDGWMTKHPEKRRPDFPVKGRRAHLQRLHPDAALALSAQVLMLSERGWYAVDGPVFPTSRGGGWRPNANAIAPEELRELAKAAGLSGRWVTHSLRHTFATLETNAPGSSARAAQQRIGHASLAQLDRYVHDASHAPASAIGRLPPALPEAPSQSNDEDDEGSNGTIH